MILLLSDGANTSGRTQPLDAAADAKQLGVAIFAIALGTDTGMVDVPDGNGQLRRIPVPPDPTTLHSIAEQTGGRSFAGMPAIMRSQASRSTAKARSLASASSA